MSLLTMTTITSQTTIVQALKGNIRRQQTFYLYDTIRVSFCSCFVLHFLKLNSPQQSPLTIISELDHTDLSVIVFATHLKVRYLGDKVVSALAFHGRGRWFESGQRSPSHSALEMGSRVQIW